jgi:plastocyanin
VGLAGCAGDGGTTDEGPTETPGERVVEMTDALKFEPATVEVTAGTTVRWENVGGIAHSVTAYEDAIPADADYFASGDFDSQSAAAAAYPETGSIGGDAAYSHTFTVEGQYDYFCIPHESGMQGTVVVG